MNIYSYTEFKINKKRTSNPNSPRTSNQRIKVVAVQMVVLRSTAALGALTDPQPPAR